MSDLVVARPEGLYCPPGGFFIDPWQPVDRAVITHAHGDHARPGHGHYLASRAAEPVMHVRLPGASLTTLEYGETVHHQGVAVSLHPAGHVLGSAQVRIEHRGEVWVASGDYYVAGERDDPREGNRTCTPFEPVRCHCFITESTFGLPIYRWAPQDEVFASVNAWWAEKASCRALSSPFDSRPSTVSTSLSSAWTPKMRQDLAGRPSSNTVHAPQIPCSHPRCVPV